MQNKLKPCPFCGGRAIILQTETFFSYPRYFATCDSCGVETPRVYKTRAKSIEAWNRRAYND